MRFANQRESVYFPKVSAGSFFESHRFLEKCMHLSSYRAILILNLILAAFIILFVSGFASAAEKQTLTGTVSDSMCNTQHMGGTPADCTRNCVGHGAKYTLIVGDKIYALNTTDKALLAVLDKEAGRNVTVTGSVNGVGVDVNSVVPAK